MSSITERYLDDTLHRILKCKCNGGCILKSMKVENQREITVEPYDDRFDVDVVERTLHRRRKSILKALGTEFVTATVFDEWRMYGAYTLTKDGLERVA